MTNENIITIGRYAEVQEGLAARNSAERRYQNFYPELRYADYKELWPAWFKRDGVYFPMSTRNYIEFAAEAY